VVHRTVSGAPGWLGQTGRSREIVGDVRLKFTGLSGEPTVGRANGRLRDLRETRGRANGRERAPDSVRCANGSQALTVGYATEGKKSAPDSVRWCTGLSGAPGDRRQELPSRIALNGS
jgi:hypothetical protein